ncbi:MAG TPA: hypothetical protein VGC46_10385 [Allosphingosinicella sp.]
MAFALMTKLENLGFWELGFDQKMEARMPNRRSPSDLEMIAGNAVELEPALEDADGISNRVGADSRPGSRARSDWKRHPSQQRGQSLGGVLWPVGDN